MSGKGSKQSNAIDDLRATNLAVVSVEVHIGVPLVVYLNDRIRNLSWCQRVKEISMSVCNTKLAHRFALDASPRDAITVSFSRTRIAEGSDGILPITLALAVHQDANRIEHVSKSPDA